MSVNGKFAGISHADLMVVAERAGIGTAPRVLEQVKHAVSAWPDYALEAKVNASETKRIRLHHGPF